MPQNILLGYFLTGQVHYFHQNISIVKKVSLTQKLGPAASLSQLPFYLGCSVFRMSPPLALHKGLHSLMEIFCKNVFSCRGGTKLLQKVFFVQLREGPLFREGPATFHWPGQVSPGLHEMDQIPL